jgi:hypothetical protein
VTKNGQANPRRRITFFRRLVAATAQSTQLDASRVGAPPSAMYRVLNETRSAIARGRLSPREFKLAWREGHTWTAEQVDAQVKSFVISELV